MADFQAHIKQAKKNLTILAEINQKINDSWDWQITDAYYVAVHLMNAHLASKALLHYRTHKDVKLALSGDTSVCKIPDPIYTSYIKLENLSRRARYLCHEDQIGNEAHAFETYDRHLKKAISHLDKILIFFAKEYALTFNVIKIDCIEIKNVPLTYFEYSQATRRV